MLCCGFLYRWLGGEFETFQLHVLVQQLSATANTRSGADKIAAGDQKVQTSVSETGVWQEELVLTVLQGTRKLVISLLDEDEKLVGKARLDVKKDLLDGFNEESGGFLNESWLECLHKGKVVGSILMSFSTTGVVADVAPRLKARGIDTTQMSGPLARMLAEAERRYEHRQHQSSDLQAGSSWDKMEILAGACKGPVEKTASWGFTQDRYLKVFAAQPSKEKDKRRSAQWYLGLFESKAEASEGKPLKAMPMLRITAVYQDTSSDDFFVVRYMTETEERREIIMRKVDRERGTWVEALRLFIQELRKEKAGYAKKSEKSGAKSRQANQERRKKLTTLEEGGSCTSSSGIEDAARSMFTPTTATGSGSVMTSATYMSSTSRKYYQNDKEVAAAIKIQSVRRATLVRRDSEVKNLLTKGRVTNQPQSGT